MTTAGPRIVYPVAIALVVLAAIPRSVLALTPKSPEVKESCNKAIRFLESSGQHEERIGGKALVGMALLKHGHSTNHPQVEEAVEAIRNVVDQAETPDKIEFGPGPVYSAGLAAIFLCQCDPVRNRVQINAILKHLQSIQKKSGGWGYRTRQTGDTSMTQYGVLSAWEATQVGFDIPQQSTDRVTQWLLRTQDPSGGFGYQGNPSPNSEPIKQEEIRPSLSAAGLGSVYICADLLGLNKKRHDDGLPDALVEIKEDSADEKRPRTTIDRRLIREVQARGNQWMEGNVQVNQPKWTHYYLYALERYWSFRELSEGAPQGSSKWYDEGAKFLLETQAENGSWESDGGASVDTSFGVLFLLRSSQKSIQKAKGFGAGTLIGGRGLPRDTDSIRVRDGNVVATPDLSILDQLLAAMDDSKGVDYAEAAEMLTELPPDKAAAMVAKHADKLRNLAGGSSPDARMAAVRALGRTRNMDNVPTLIYALTDPHMDVVLEARDGLRRISRKFRGFGLTEESDETKRRQIIKQWKAWYKSLQPDAVFPD